MLVPSGMRYLKGVLKSSVKYHPLRLTALVFGLYNSMLSVTFTVRVRASLISTGKNTPAGGLDWPGDPSTPLLGRHCRFSVQSSGCACSSTITSENPSPSVIGYQALLYVKSRIS